MGYNWEKYGRRSLDFASTIATIGFTTAKSSTRFGVRRFHLDTSEPYNTDPYPFASSIWLEQ